MAKNSGPARIIHERTTGEERDDLRSDSGYMLSDK